MSYVGLGAVLVQKTEDGQPIPLSMPNRTLQPLELVTASYMINIMDEEKLFSGYNY